MNQQSKRSSTDEPPKWALIYMFDWYSVTRLFITVTFVHGTQEPLSTHPCIESNVPELYFFSNEWIFSVFFYRICQVFWSNLLMVNWAPMFGGVIHLVIFSWLPNYGEFFSSNLSGIQWYLIYQLLERFCFISLLANPATVELSVIIFVVSF